MSRLLNGKLFFKNVCHIAKLFEHLGHKNTNPFEEGS